MRRYTFVAAMIASFVFGMMRAELRWQRYFGSGFRGKGDVPYFATVPYSVRQILDLNWIALVPLRGLHALPRGVALDDRPDGRSQPRPGLAAVVSVGVFWAGVVAWFGRLNTNHGTSLGRIAGVIALIVSASLLVLAVRSQTEGEFTKPRLSDAAVVPALTLFLMSLAQLGWLTAIFRRRWHYVLIPALLATTFLWADRRDRSEFEANESRYRTCVEQNKALDAGCWHFQHVPSPVVLDLLFVHLPPAIVLELSSLTRPGPANRNSFMRSCARVATVAAYWWLLVLVTAGPNSRIRRIKATLRPWALTLLGILLGTTLLGWLIGVGAHGYTGAFGRLLGVGALWPAFFRRGEEKPVCPQPGDGPNP